MEKSNVIDGLKNEAKTNPTANAVFHVWAMRKRARHSVTLSALKVKMEKEGFKYSDDKYRALLAFLAANGFGVLDKDSKGRVTALRGLKTTLQSIGKAACGEGADFKRFRQRNRFTALPTTPAKPPVKIPAKAAEALPNVPVQLVVFINEKKVSIPLTKDLDSKDIAELVHRFQEAST